MIREIILWVSEALFYLLNGVMLINTPWIFLWVLFWSLVISAPMLYTINIRPTKWASLVFIIAFFPILLIVMGPPIIQLEMMHECETVQQIVSTDRVDEHVIDIRQCRVKDNYYGEFGDWEIYRGDR